MVCSKCEIQQSAVKTAKENNISIKNSNTIARIVYEEMMANESNEFKESVSKNGVLYRNRIDGEYKCTPNEAIASYELAFKEVLNLKLTPIKKYEDIETIREQLWRLEDKLHDTRYTYLKVAVGNEDQKESALLNVRLRVRESFNGKESNEQNQKIHETDTSTRERQFDPSQCEEGTFRTITLGKGKKGVICKKKGEDKTSLQTIITPKKEKIETSSNEKIKQAARDQGYLKDGKSSSKKKKKK